MKTRLEWRLWCGARVTLRTLLGCGETATQRGMAGPVGNINEWEASWNGGEMKVDPLQYFSALSLSLLVGSSMERLCGFLLRGIGHGLARSLKPALCGVLTHMLSPDPNHPSLNSPPPDTLSGFRQRSRSSSSAPTEPDRVTPGQMHRLSLVNPESAETAPVNSPRIPEPASDATIAIGEPSH